MVMVGVVVGPAPVGCPGVPLGLVVADVCPGVLVVVLWVVVPGGGPPSLVPWLRALVVDLWLTLELLILEVSGGIVLVSANLMVGLILGLLTGLTAVPGWCCGVWVVWWVAVGLFSLVDVALSFVLLMQCNSAVTVLGDLTGVL